MGVKFTLCFFFLNQHNIHHPNTLRWRNCLHFWKLSGDDVILKNVELGKLNILRNPNLHMDTFTHTYVRIHIHTYTYPHTHTYTHTHTGTNETVFGFWQWILSRIRVLNSAKCSARWALHFLIWRRPLSDLRIVYKFSWSRGLEWVSERKNIKTHKVESLGFW